MSVQKPQPPEWLQRGVEADAPSAKILSEKVWKRLWVHNEHFMAAIVGREGSGKSYTGIKISECVDPTFTAERVMFEPVKFLKRLKTWKEEKNTQGKMVVIDEAGVGVGVRTWYEKDQVRLNQVLQIIRDENMGVLFTLPRLEELDSQTRGRLHALIQMIGKKDGEWAKLKWWDWDPTRDGRNDVYHPRPELHINGGTRPVNSLKFSPPSDDIVEAYEHRKSEFQTKEYQSAIDDMEQEPDEEMSVREVAIEIADGEMENYVDLHSQNNTPYINDRLIRADYEISQNDAKGVKDLLKRQFSTEELREYA